MAVRTHGSGSGPRRFTGGRATSVPDGCEIAILPAVSGG